MEPVEGTGRLDRESIEGLDRRLRLTSLVATVGIPVAVVFFEGTLLHLILSLTAIVAGLAFLWRARRKAAHGKLLVGLAVSVSFAWLGGILWFASYFAQGMAEFN